MIDIAFLIFIRLFDNVGLMCYYSLGELIQVCHITNMCHDLDVFSYTHGTFEVGILVETLAPFQTNVSDFPYPTSDLNCCFQYILN